MKNIINRIRKALHNEAAYYRIMCEMYEDLKPIKQTFFRFMVVQIRLRLIKKYFWYARYLVFKNKTLSNISVAAYEWFYKNAAKLPGRKVYAVHFSRDCDMCESNRRIEFKNRFDYNYSLMHIMDDAEGPQSLTIISKEEYDEFKSSNRDRVMEAFENGNGFSIYV